MKFESFTGSKSLSLDEVAQMCSGNEACLAIIKHGEFTDDGIPEVNENEFKEFVDERGYKIILVSEAQVSKISFMAKCQRFIVDGDFTEDKDFMAGHEIYTINMPNYETH